ncbi:ankyrin repeat domain-containing protein [Vibrio sp. NFV-1]|uniref:Ankyrin repeat domain-containing protein n=2 Tax=Vibrio nitrifigilis TaxID=2789781 RepID=A0ABS0GB88_9VIBR|nr:ankyrin repeat domain-containing protein [Vibrio nitrifigilis]
MSNKINPKDLFSGPMLEVAQAVNSQDIEKIKQLASQLDDINARGEHGVTLLVYAVIANKLDAIKVLMELGSDPSIDIPEQGNAGYISMWHPDAKALEVLLQSGMDPNLNEEGDPLIFHSHNIDESNSLPVLVQYGADVNALNEKGETPIFGMLSVQFKNALYLLDHGADGHYVTSAGISVAYSVEFELEHIDPNSEAYQTMLQIKEKLISQGVKFPALSPWGERFVRDIVFCKEPSGDYPRSECKIEGVNPFVKEPSDEIKRQDEAILKERYGIEHQF